MIIPPFFHLIFTHYAYLDHCKLNHPDIDPYRCSLVYFFSKGFMGYDYFSIHGEVYYDFKDEEKASAPAKANL